MVRVLDLQRLLAQRLGQRIGEAGNRLVEAAVGHHRRDRRAHADVRVALGDRLDAGRRRQRELGEHVVRRGAALAHHLRRADHRREVVVLDRAAPGRPGARVEIGLEVVAVEQALREVRLRVVVAVHEAGDDELARGVDAPRVAVLDRARRDDVGDRVAVDEDVGGRALEIRPQHAAALDEQHGSLLFARRELARARCLRDAGCHTRVLEPEEGRVPVGRDREPVR